jgi:hypothetical protein
MFDFDHGGQTVTTTPFQTKLRFWKRKIGPAAIAGAKAAIHEMIAKGEVHTTTWMCSDWGAAFDPIFLALQDKIEVAKCYGLLVSECVLDREHETGELWGFKHCEKDGVPIRGRTYFRLGVTPQAA